MYNGTTINDSATIVAAANAAISGGEFLAAKFTNGKIAVCSVAGENALGIIIPGQDAVAQNDDVTIQIKEIGRWKAGAAISAGAELTTDANGAAITATSGAFILAIALESAAAAGAIIQVQIVKAGYKSGGSVAPLTLAGLTDVNITSVAGGDAIVYDGTTTKYVNKALALGDLADVGITSETDGDVLTYDGTDTEWQNKQ